MVKVKLQEGKFIELEKYSKDEESLFLDGLLKKNLDLCKTNIRKDWDFLFVIDGEVGSGKSHFAQEMAYYVSDGNFSLDQVCINPEQFKKAIINAEKYTAVIFDEAFRGLSSRASMTQTNRTIVSMLQEIRQKNLFVFVVLPSIWDVDRYIALHRCKGLFHVHTDEIKNRGFFKFYKKEKVMWLISKADKMRYKYPAAPQFKGRFTKLPKCMPYTLEAYNAKKAASLGEYEYKKEARVSVMEKRWRERTAILIERLKMETSVNEISTLLGVDNSYIAKIVENPQNVTEFGANNSSNLKNPAVFDEIKEE